MAFAILGGTGVEIVTFHHFQLTFSGIAFVLPNHQMKFLQPSYVRLILFSEMPAREGWVCDFESGQVCLNFRMSGWLYFSPAQHSADTQYEPEVDHTSGRDSGQLRLLKTRINHCDRVRYF